MGGSSHQIPLPLKDEAGFSHRNLTVRRRVIALSVEFRIVRLILLEHIVNSREEHFGNGDDSFLVAPTFFECEAVAANIWKLLGADRIERTLNKQRLNVGSDPADSGGFLLPGTLVVLRRKPDPGAKVLRGGEHGHIQSDFRNDADSGKGLDTRYRHNKVELGKMLLSSG